jgi:hypothetical protein
MTPPLDNSIASRYRDDVHATVDVSSAGISRVATRRRDIPLAAVRRVHVFIDANGDDGIVVRSTVFRYVFVSRAQLADPNTRSGLRHLVDQVRSFAQVDAGVHHLLAAA